MYEGFISTASLFGVISEVYCECLLTCHNVWRCVTVLEYILVQCESVCGCINVCRAPPAWLRANLANGRNCAAESGYALQDARRAAAPHTWAAFYPPTGGPLPSPAAAPMCATPALGNQTQGWGRESGIMIGDGVGEQCVWWLNNKCGILGCVWSQDWSLLLWWRWGERQSIEISHIGLIPPPGIKSGTEVNLLNRSVVFHKHSLVVSYVNTFCFRLLELDIVVFWTAVSTK